MPLPDDQSEKFIIDWDGLFASERHRLAQTWDQQLAQFAVENGGDVRRFADAGVLDPNSDKLIAWVHHLRALHPDMTVPEIAAWAQEGSHGRNVGEDGQAYFGRVITALFGEDVADRMFEDVLQHDAQVRRQYVEEFNEHQAEAVHKERLRRHAIRTVDAEEFAEAIGDRPKLTMEQFVELPRHVPVMEKVLAAEVNLLGGPQEAGKSLLARDWSLHVASGKAWRGHPVIERRNVLWIASEGMHDAEDRWMSQPLWNDAKANVYTLAPVDLVHGPDVDWLLKEYAEERPGLVVFDVIYGMGMSDDNGVRDVLPVLNSMKRISAEWNAATLALGHPGLNGHRRFRGSSMWRNLAYTEWHLAEHRLSCEKSKLADKARLGSGYQVDYPYICWLEPMENLKDQALREQMVLDDLAMFPEDGIRERARRLVPLLEISDSSVRRMIRRLGGS